MTTNKYFGITLIIISGYLMASQSGCHGFCSPGSRDNRISLKGGTVTIIPDKDSIKVGDTLWLNSIIPAKLTELFGNGDSSTIDFSGASNITTDFHMDVVTMSFKQSGAIDSFTYIPLKGTIAINKFDSFAAKSVTFNWENGFYQFSMGIITKKKGIYALSFIDIYQAQKKCLFASIEVVMNNPDNHTYYLNAIHYPGSPYGASIYPIERTHIYCFKVY